MSGDRHEAIETALQAHLAGLTAALYSAPDAALLTVAQVEAVSDYAARQHLALLRERDALARWKAEALPLLDGLQELGRALDLPLGERVTGRRAAEAAAALRAERDGLRGQL